MTDTGNETANAADSGRDLDLFDIPRLIWKRRRTVRYFAAASLLMASLYLHVARYTYTAELTVTPVHTSDSGLSSKLGGLADLASAANLNIPQEPGELQFQLYMEGIHSRAVADALSKRIDLMKIIFRTEWDNKTGRWKDPSGALSPLKRAIKFIVGVPNYDWQPPNGARLQLYIIRFVKVEQVPKKPLVTITFQNRNPKFAVAFLTALHEADESILRQKALSISEQYIQYLTGKLATVTVTEQRQAITTALSEQEKSMMMASSNAPFAAESFGDPSASFRPTSPIPMVVLGAGIIFGFLFGSSYALLAEIRVLPVIPISMPRSPAALGWFLKTVRPGRHPGDEPFRSGG